MNDATATALPAPEPEITIESQPFWDATARGELSIPRCDDCGSFIWYPRAICPDCHSTRITWERVSGRGTVYTYTVIRRGLGEYADAAPYVVAYVELDEGVRLLTNIIWCDPDDVRIGMKVAVDFVPTPGGVHLHRFRPA